MEMGHLRESLGFHLVKPCDVGVLGKNHPKVWISVFLHKFAFYLFSTLFLYSFMLSMLKLLN
jgi:hypothetical protein